MSKPQAHSNKKQRATTIVLELRSDDWISFFKKDSRRWGTGKTDKEAIANLLTLHPRQVTGPLQYEYIELTEGQKRNPLVKDRELCKGTWCKIVART